MYFIWWKNHKLLIFINYNLTGDDWVSSVQPRWTPMKCTTTCRVPSSEGNRCELFRTTLAWKKEVCFESFAQPGDKGTCAGDSGGNDFNIILNG